MLQNTNGTTNSQFSFQTNFYIPFHEVDHAGIMFFAHLFTHAHDTYEQFMAHLELNLNRDWTHEHYLLPIIHAEANYHAPLHHGMTINVQLNIANIGNTSFITEYKFLEHTEQLHAMVQLVHCCIDLHTRTAKILPNELRIKLQRYKK